MPRLIQRVPYHGGLSSGASWLTRISPPSCGLAEVVRDGAIG
jgi:hypothetical protein